MEEPTTGANDIEGCCKLWYYVVIFKLEPKLTVNINELMIIQVLLIINLSNVLSRRFVKFSIISTEF